ncbi:hypothetical protein ACNZ61_002822 [Enterococcus hirae]
MRIFNHRVEKELEEKGIQPTEAVKKLEHSRQILHVVIGILATLAFLLGAGMLYFQNKDQSEVSTMVSSTQEESKVLTEQMIESSVDMTADHLLKLDAKERAGEAITAFKNWYYSFKNDTPILEINKELLTDPSGTSPYDLQEKLIQNMQDRFGPLLSDSYYHSLSQALNANPLVIDAEKGLTWSYEGDNENWLMTWIFDTAQEKKNTKIVLRNDFPYEWADWRGKYQYNEKVGSLLKSVDWNNDIAHEVIGISMLADNKEKHIKNLGGVFLVMAYNEEIGFWQLTGTLGGVYE